MFHRALPALLLLLVVSLLIAESASSRSQRGRRQHHRDRRVYDARPSDKEHDEDDADDDDLHEDEDEHEKTMGGRGAASRDRAGRHEEDDDDDHHEDDGGKHEHDASYDRESFLGHEELRRFEEMSAKEAQSALLDLLPKLDANNDSKVSMEEMQAWLAAVAKRERRISSDKRFESIKLFNHALDVHAPLTFEEYKKDAQHDIVGDGEPDKKALEAFNSQLVRDQARWAKADADGDRMLNKAEFADFLRPEEAPHMRDIVIQEAMISTDKNKDGKVDMNEFMADLHPNYEADIKAKKKMPKWIEKEEKKFREKLDLNKDGVLDPNEVYKWVVPEDFDHSRKETLHLFKMADQNNDKVLTREEMLNKWSIFVGHKPESASSQHEEL